MTEEGSEYNLWSKNSFDMDHLDFLSNRENDPLAALLSMNVSGHNNALKEAFESAKNENNTSAVSGVANHAPWTSSSSTNTFPIFTPRPVVYSPFPPSPIASPLPPLSRPRQEPKARLMTAAEFHQTRFGSFRLSVSPPDSLLMNNEEEEDNDDEAEKENLPSPISSSQQLPSPEKEE